MERFTFILLIFSTSLCAQTITRIEYYFDIDPGFGNGISIPVSAASDLTADFSVPLNTVSEGFHLFYIRAKSNNGLWSLPLARPVLVQRNAQVATLFSIDRIEYFYDLDPGIGSGISIPITSASKLTLDISLPLGQVSEGFHNIYFRARSTNGLWSIPTLKPVFVQRNAQTTSTTSLKRLEYFFDTDPGPGNGTIVTTASNTFDQGLLIDLSSTSAGFHILYVRAEDANGRWSQPLAKPFFAGKSGSNIIALEYYYYDGTSKSSIKVYNNFTAGKDVTIDFAAVLDGLLPNTSYEIHITAINSDGLRSAETTHTFVTPDVICDPLTPPAVIAASRCEAGSVDLTASGATGSQTYNWYESATGGTAIQGATGSTFTTPFLSATTTFYVTIQNGTCESNRTAVVAQINTLPNAPVTTDGSACGPNASVQLTVSGGTNGQYRWYTSATNGTSISGQVNSTYITPIINATTLFYVSIKNGTCESTRTEIKATLLTTPDAPTIISGSNCGPGTVTLQAAGATNGQYRWYTVAAGGTALAGETNAGFITPALTTTNTYYVSINNGSCESTRTAVLASILTPPAKPAITASEPVSAGVVQLCLNAITLTAPAGFTYTWSSGETTQTISVAQSGNYSVVIKDSDGCSSVSSDVLQVVKNNACVNSPPVINSASLITPIGGFVTIDLTTYISDPDNNLDPASLQVVGNKTQRGGKTTLTGFILELDYSNLNFAGSDLVTIRACDQLGVCVEKELVIEVIGDINVFNGISPNGDGINDTWIIEYIDLFPDTQKNRVTLYNRWGDIVWEISDYNNTSAVFTGLNKNGNELTTGTYFYKIEFTGGRDSITGYLSVKR